MANEQKMISVGKMDEIMEERFPAVEIIDYYGEELCIQKVIPFNVFTEIVHGVIDSCFIADTSEYTPESLDFAKRLCVVSAYTNVRLPKDTEKQYQFLYRTNLWETVLSIIDRGQYTALVEAIDDGVCTRNDTNRKAFEAMLWKASMGISEFADGLSGLLDGINQGDVQNLMRAFGAGAIDEEKLVHAVIAEQNKSKELEDAGNMDGQTP